MQTQLIRRPVPMEIRWLLSMAGWLLPPTLRSDWLREWYAEFWHWSADRRKLRARALGAFPDAWLLLRQNYGTVRRIRDASHSRSAPLIALILLVAAIAAATGGFSRGRNLLFHDDSRGLVLIAQPIPFMGLTSRISAAQADAWLVRSQTVSRLGKWSVEDRLRNGRHARVCTADTGALILIAQAPVEPRCDWTEPLVSNPPPYTGVVAQLKSGTTIQEAQRELAQTAGLHKGWVRPSVVSLAALRKAPLAPVGSVLLGLMLWCALAVRALTIRAWMWGASKIAPSFLLIAAIWLELIARAPFTETAGIPTAWSWLLYILPVLAGAWFTWMFRRDSRHHCRVCYRPLTMPVSVGVSGRCLFDPGGTEYLCGAGHGSLLVSFVAEQMGGDVWATWSDSWA